MKKIVLQLLLFYQYPILFYQFRNVTIYNIRYEILRYSLFLIMSYTLNNLITNHQSSFMTASHRLQAHTNFHDDF